MLFIIRASGENYAEYDLRWYAARDSMRSVSGFDGYVIAGGRVYRGVLRELRTIPHVSDGAYRASGEELRALRELYAEAPYLFDVRDPNFISKRSNPVAEMVNRVREGTIPRKKMRDWGGPAICVLP